MNSDFSGPGLQNNWKECAKCQTMVFAGNASAGACPAGGQHDNSTIGTVYLVPFVGSGISGQSNWRWCNKCQALAFGGSASAGPCSAGGQHDHTGSGDYVLPQKGAGPVPPDTRENWRWCKKCQVLAFAGNTSKACAAGGVHDYSASGDYMVGYAIGADTVLLEAYKAALKPKASGMGA
jgi:hypothetical protein